MPHSVPLLVFLVKLDSSAPYLAIGSEDQDKVGSQCHIHNLLASKNAQDRLFVAVVGDRFLDLAGLVQHLCPPLLPLVP